MARSPISPSRLAAFCRQHYGGPVQVVCGAQGDLAPATAAVGEVNSKFPDRIELVADQRSHGANGKVSNLINMLPRARYDTIVLSDSDIVVERDYLRRSWRSWASPMSAPSPASITASAATGLWSRISALATNSHFLPQAITALGLRLGKPCCGATIALRRSMLDRIGGFHAFADVLADDYAIGVAVRAAGYDVKTAPFLVGHRCFEGSLRRIHAAPDPRGAHHQEHLPDRLRRHHLDPPVAACSSRHALRRHHRDAFDASRCWRRG